MPNKKEQAMHMYLNESCTQQHIATTLGISVRTIYSWIRQNSWDRLRQASLAAPVIIADNMCFQLIAMQQTIAAREPGQQFPTMHEAEIARKLVGCIDKLKRYPSLTQSIQVLETFRQYVREGNERDSWPIERWMGKFMASKAKGGFRPNDIEYNAENLSPFGMPFEEETIDDTPTYNPPNQNTIDFSCQLETLIKTTSQKPENQSNNISTSSVERQPNRQLSEIKQQIPHPGKRLNFGRHTSGKSTNKSEPPIHNSSSPGTFKIAESPGHNPSFVIHNSTLQLKTLPQNSITTIENQLITATSDSAENRKKPEAKLQCRQEIVREKVPPNHPTTHTFLTNYHFSPFSPTHPWKYLDVFTSITLHKLFHC